jgi:hypothetical protein
MNGPGCVESGAVALRGSGAGKCLRHSHLWVTVIGMCVPPSGYGHGLVSLISSVLSSPEIEKLL